MASAKVFFFLNLKGILTWHSVGKERFTGQLEDSVSHCCQLSKRRYFYPKIATGSIIQLIFYIVEKFYLLESYLKVPQE